MSEPTHLMVGPDESDNAQFGVILRQFRTEAQLSRSQAANILGFSSEYLRLIERGKRTPALGSMGTIMSTYHVDHDIGAGYLKFGDFFVEFTSRIQEARGKPIDTSIENRDMKIGQIVRLLAIADNAALHEVHKRLRRV